MEIAPRDQQLSLFIKKLQATCYGMMAEELTGLNFPQIVVIIAVDHEPTQVFVKPRDLYVDRVLEIFA